MFRRTKHYMLTAPMECRVSNGQSFTGELINLSLHGAFVAGTRRCVQGFEPLDRVGIQLLGRHRGTDFLNLEIQARIIWRNDGSVDRLPWGLGLEFIHDDQTLRQCVDVMSDLCRRDVVKQDRAPLSNPADDANSV